MRTRGAQKVSAESEAIANVSAEERTGDLFGAAQPPANEADRAKPLRREENLSALCGELDDRGYRVSLTVVARWLPSEREMAAEWLAGERTAPPMFLENFKKSKPVDDYAGKAPAPAVAAVEETVTVMWGEEKFGMPNYSSFTAPMVSAKVIVKPGETITDAARRAYVEVEKLGEEFRERKRVSFLKAFAQVNK